MLRAELQRVLVCTRLELHELRPLDPLPARYRFRDMDPSDELDVGAWLRIHNSAFERAWGVEEYRRAVVANPDVSVAETALLYDGDEPVGAISIGAFRRNPGVAVGHYLAVVPSRQGRGLGTALIAHSNARAQARSFEIQEGQTQIWRVGSLVAQFDRGYQPKYRLDPWNPSGSRSRVARAVATARLANLYRRWRRRS